MAALFTDGLALKLLAKRPTADARLGLAGARPPGNAAAEEASRFDGTLNSVVGSLVRLRLAALLLSMQFVSI